MAAITSGVKSYERHFSGKSILPKELNEVVFEHLGYSDLGAIETLDQFYADSVRDVLVKRFHKLFKEATSFLLQNYRIYLGLQQRAHLVALENSPYPIMGHSCVESVDKLQLDLFNLLKNLQYGMLGDIKKNPRASFFLRINSLCAEIDNSGFARNLTYDQLIEAVERFFSLGLFKSAITIVFKRSKDLNDAYRLYAYVAKVASRNDEFSVALEALKMIPYLNSLYYEDAVDAACSEENYEWAMKIAESAPYKDAEYWKIIEMACRAKKYKWAIKAAGKIAYNRDEAYKNIIKIACGVKDYKWAIRAAFARAESKKTQSSDFIRGKNKTSLIDADLEKSMTSRSIPMPTPEAGGIP